MKERKIRERFLECYHLVSRSNNCANILLPSSNIVSFSNKIFLIQIVLLFYYYHKHLGIRVSLHDHTHDHIAIYVHEFKIILHSSVKMFQILLDKTNDFLSKARSFEYLQIYFIDIVVIGTHSRH